MGFSRKRHLDVYELSSLCENPTWRGSARAKGVESAGGIAITAHALLRAEEHLGTE